MKTIIVASLLALSTSAHADSFAWMRNNAGGKIIITDDACPIKGTNKNARKAQSYSSTGRIMTGCWGVWKYDESKVLIYWEDSDESKLYDLSDFNLEERKSNGTEL